MIVIRMYAHGAGVKVRWQQHEACCDDGSCSQPDEETTERAYPEYRADPSTVWKCVAQALHRQVRARSYRSLLNGLQSQERLF